MPSNPSPFLPQADARAPPSHPQNRSIFRFLSRVSPQAAGAAYAKNAKFSAVSHFFGYEGRCSLPSNFDANYCYALGHTSAALIEAGVTGVCSTVRGLPAFLALVRCAAGTRLPICRGRRHGRVQHGAGSAGSLT